MQRKEDWGIASSLPPAFLCWLLFGDLPIGLGLRKPLPLLQFLRQFVKLTLFHVLRDVRIDIHGGVEVGMTKDLLNDLDIDAVLRACLKTFDKNGGMGDNRKKQAGAGENASIPKRYHPGRI